MIDTCMLFMFLLPKTWLYITKSPANFAISPLRLCG